LFEDALKGGNVLTGLAVGIGLVVLAPAVVPALRPMAKSMIKAGVVAYEQGRQMLAELSETTSDLVAEARQELAAAPVAAKAAGADEHSPGTA
jgi:hypothetical protein